MGLKSVELKNKSVTLNILLLVLIQKKSYGIIDVTMQKIWIDGDGIEIWTL